MNCFVHCNRHWWPFLWRPLKPLALGVRPEVRKRDVSLSAFWVSFCTFFFFPEVICVLKQPWQNLGRGKGLQIVTAISLMLCVLVTYTLGREFSLVTPVRQENWWWSQVCPFVPSSRLQETCRVKSLWRHKRQWLCSQFQDTFQGGITPKSFACSLAQFFWEMHPWPLLYWPIYAQLCHVGP